MEKSQIRILFASNLKRIRREHNISQLKLAIECDFSPTFISSIEAQRKWISPETLEKLCTVLNVQPYQFFLPLTQEERSNLVDDQRVNYILQQLSEFVADVSKRYS